MSWAQLKDILEQNRQEQAAESREPPLTCPIDGELLDIHPDGRRNCPMGNYRWNGGPVVMSN